MNDAQVKDVLTQTFELLKEYHLQLTNLDNKVRALFQFAYETDPASVAPLEQKKAALAHETPFGAAAGMLRLLEITLRELKKET